MLETGHHPVYYFPREDVGMDLLERTRSGDCEPFMRQPVGDGNDAARHIEPDGLCGIVRAGAKPSGPVTSRSLTNAVEQLDDQRHERRSRNAVQRHREAGEGSGYLTLLKGASSGYAVARQAHRKTASVPFLDAGKPQYLAREASAHNPGRDRQHRGQSRDAADSSGDCHRDRRGG